MTLMVNIGVVLPRSKMNEHIKGLFKRYRYKVVPVAEYGFNYIVAFDNSRCDYIFAKNNVDSIVLLTDMEVELCSYKILDGQRAYFAVLPDFLRRVLKSKEMDASVAVLSEKYTDDLSQITDKLCTMCKSVSVFCKDVDLVEKMAENFEQKYGIIIEVKNACDKVTADFAVVLDGLFNNVSPKCTVISRNKIKGKNVVCDFRIPFKTRPPLGISNLVFAECVGLASQSARYMHIVV